MTSNLNITKSIIKSKPQLNLDPYNMAVVKSLAELLPKSIIVTIWFWSAEFRCFKRKCFLQMTTS